ncbi:metabolite traffic protein EboE [Kribbella sp. CA-293567]|uniref:metabolite traffic protein EboE n=1 Tax=Kribbella sp. CA-293567 TaxID=3002436 RepID=UPI0022DDC8DA|nr:metabolite traffic protein EboE [Kribbella sp. CA-293567]WBQ03084.1 metabolite traffic protein EboE [Kribbella sp. CA-293567]
MRFRHPDGSVVHLAYCTNVHPAEDLEGVIAQLDGCSALVREELGVPVLGVGLWLANTLADRLANSSVALNRLRRALDRNGLEVVTLNGFPYAGFHDRVVGKKVYSPDWTEPARLQYTLDLVDVLAELMPADAAYGSISTLPLAWRTPWNRTRDAQAREAFNRLELRLARSQESTGRRIRVAIEPEPGCILEMIPQAADWLTPYAAQSLVGLCLDTCHLAVQFEEPAEAFATLRRAGVEVVKSQVSAALHVPHPDDPVALELLNEFAEPKFLHQTREYGGPGIDDLDLIDQLSGRASWRVHFHVPVHAAPRPPLTSTTGVLEESLQHLVGGVRPLTHHLESETYTWSVLPTAPKNQRELAEGIAGELAWLRDRLVGLGLEEIK